MVLLVSAKLDEVLGVELGLHPAVFVLGRDAWPFNCLGRGDATDLTNDEPVEELSNRGEHPLRGSLGFAIGKELLDVRRYVIELLVRELTPK